MFTEKINPIHSITYVWQQKNHVRILWLTLLMFQDAHGIIPFCKDQLIKISNLTETEYNYAIDVLTGNNTNDTCPLIKVNNDNIQLIFDKNELRRKRNELRTANKPKWRENSEEGFKQYQDETFIAFTEMFADKKWIALLQRQNPSIDIEKWLTDQYNTYWNTVDGWNNKRRKKTIKINWFLTMEKNLSYMRRKF